MPPKAKPNNKEQQKKMQKKIEDMTFGLKNKKGAKMQKYIKQLENQVKGNAQNQKPQQKKKTEEDDLKDLSKIFKPVQSMPKRAALSTKNQTKVTLQTFIAWKKKKLRERKLQVVEDEKRKKASFKSGQKTGLSGRELFTYDPQAGGEDDEDATDVAVEREKPEGEDEVKALVIDERTFYDIGEDGAMLDDDLDDEPESSQPAPVDQPANDQKPLVFDESVFNAEEELPDSDDDGDDEDDDAQDSEEDDDQPGSSGVQTLGKKVEDKLKV